MPSLAERLALCALTRFDALPHKCKPRFHPDGRREWTPMSAVILVQGAQEEKIACVSLATGTKCLSASALPRCLGSVLHDSHAEVLALRGFNHWLLSEIRYMLEHPAYHSGFVHFDEHYLSDLSDSRQPPFSINDDVSFHLFTTEAPCGDASMELLMSSKPPENAIPWATRQGSPSGNLPGLQGRGYFSMLGAVRRKPARADAEASLSKSCTDKIAVKQFTGLLSFPANLLVNRTRQTFLESVVVYDNQYSSTGFERAFGPSGRLSFSADFSAESQGQFFKVVTLPSGFPRFPFAKATPQDTSVVQKASNISAVWVRATTDSDAGLLEVLVNGVKQGYRQFEDRNGKESRLCRQQLWLLGRSVSGLVLETPLPVLALGTGRECRSKPHAIHSGLHAATYSEAKWSSFRQQKVSLKYNLVNQLGNWMRNVGDDDWGLP